MSLITFFPRVMALLRTLSSALRTTKLSIGHQLIDLAVISFSRAAGQGLLFLSTLYCAPFYGPESFGVAGMVTAITTMLSQFSSGRFEVLALSSRSPSVQRVYFRLCYYYNIAFLVLGSLIVFSLFLMSYISALLAMLIPISAAIVSLNQFVLPAQQVTAGEQRKIGQLAQITAMSTSTLQVLGAWLSPSAHLLVLARAVGPALGLLYGYRHLAWGLRATIYLKRPFRLRNLKVISREFIYGAPSALLSVAAFQIPVFFLNYLAMSAQAGSYWLAFNLIFVPYLIIAATFRPLFLRQLVGKGDNRCAAKLVLRSTFLAIPASLGAAVVVIVLAMIVTHFLPKDWQQTESYCFWLTILLAGLVIQTPITSASSAFRLQKINFIYNIIQVVTRSAAVIGTHVAGGSAEDIIAMFSISGFAICVLYLPINFHFIRRYAAQRKVT